MNDITLLHDYHPKRGYETWLVLLSSTQMWSHRIKKMSRELEKRFREIYGHAPRYTRVLTNTVLIAGPIKESEGALSP